MAIDSAGFGTRVARLRREARISVPELLRRANAGADGVELLGENAVRNLESGRRKDVTLGELVAISRGLNLPIAVILADPARPFAASGVEPFSRLGMTNRDVEAAFSSMGARMTPEDGGIPAPQIVHEAAYVHELMSRLGALCRAAHSLEDEWVEIIGSLDDLTDPDAFFFVSRINGLSSSDYRQLKATASLLFSAHARMLIEEKRSTLKMLSRRVKTMHGDAISKEYIARVESFFSWMSELELLHKPDALDQGIHNDVFLSKISLSYERYTVMMPCKINEMIASMVEKLKYEKGSGIKAYYRIDTECILRQYSTFFMLVCFIAIINEEPRILRCIDFASMQIWCRELFSSFPFARDKLQQISISANKRLS